MPKEKKTYASLYISQDLRDKVQAAAELKRRSFSEYVVMLIEKDISSKQASGGNAIEKELGW